MQTIFEIMHHTGAVIAEGVRKLKESIVKNNLEIDSPRLEADLLACHVLSVSRVDLYSGKASGFTEMQKENFLNLIEQRSQGRPLAYITGKKWFLNYEFTVNESVLIPRPETEILVTHALNLLKIFSDKTLNVLDLCCGSGCIGLTIAAEEPRASVLLTDISEAALSVAAQNAVNLEIDNKRILFKKSDLFERIPENLKFHAVLSNPPYIDPDEALSLKKDVAEYEPGIALFHNDIPDLYHNIIKNSAFFLYDSGFLIVETAPRWINLIETAAADFFNEIRVIPDLSGNPRHVMMRFRKLLPDRTGIKPC